MSDFLVQLGRNPQARKLFSSLGLPVKLPQDLARRDGADVEDCLAGKRVICAAAGDSALLSSLVQVAEGAGADTSVGDKPHGLVFEMGAPTSPDALRELYDFFHPRVRGVARNGRIVVVGRPFSDAGDAATAGCAHALTGFARSLAKEVGGKGTTVNLLTVAAGAEDRVAGPLRFLLSERSAFVSGQTIAVDAAASAADESGFVGSLSGKVAVVTGAARGIGAAIADRIAEEGAHVVCVDLPSSADELAEQAGSIGGSALQLDLGDEKAPAALAEHLVAKHGGVDIVVHNAGVTRDRTLGKMKDKNWDLCLGVNFGAVVRLNEALLAEGVMRDGGRLVVMASIAGFAGNPGQTNYAAAKAGLIGYAAALAPSLAGRGITINAVAPGFIETRMTAAIPVMTREVARRLNSLGQGGQPRDVADVVTFLCSPPAVGITGRAIRVCGQHLAGG